LGYRIADLDGTESRIELAAGADTPLLLRSAQERQRLELDSEGTTVVATFDDGRPAAIRVQVGAGEFFVFATCLWLAEHRAPTPGARGFLSNLAERLSLRRIHVDESSLHAAVLASGADVVASVFNYGDVQRSATVTVTCSSQYCNGGVRRVRDVSGGGTVAHESIGSGVSFLVTVSPRSVAVYHVEW
jgi:hypothetical protein